MTSKSRPDNVTAIIVRVVLWSAFSMGAAAIYSGAQTTSATISGTITDQSGALVPSVGVTVTNEDTNDAQQTRTNGAGVYSVPSLAPGHYRVAVAKEGFKQVVVRGITLNLQDVLNRNFILQVGGTSETIQVEGSGIILNTTDASVSTVVDRHFAENLPMNGRSFQTLIELTPGIVVVPSTATDSGQFSVNGQRASSNYWMVDGVSANIGVGTGGFAGGNGFAGAVGSFSASGGTNSLVSVDALQEFRIQTSTYAPEFGRTPGAQISIVTRSGTNRWHGNAFDYFRNDKLDANDWFANSVGQPKPQERQNDFGGTFSGPILKDKTFFFFSYEGLRLRLPLVRLTTVPCDSTCRTAGNVRASATPAMQPFLNAFPLPNGPEVLDSTGNATGAAQFDKSYSSKATLDAYSLRLDHRLNNKVNLFGRYNYSPSQITQRGSPFTYSSYPLSELSPNQITIQTATVGTIWTVSPAAANSLRFNYSRTSAALSQYLDNFGGAVPLTSPPFPSPFTTHNSYFALNVFSLQDGFLADGKVTRNLQRQINIVDDLSLQRASHSMKFGIDFRRLTPMTDPFEYLQEPFFFSVSSFQSGNPDGGIALGSSRSASFILQDLGVFAQDTWRVTPRLTVTYGLRWDVEFTPATADGPNLLAVTGYNLNDLSKLAVAPAGTPVFDTKYGNIAPRVGAAYQLYQNQEWQTVLRGGVGMFYDLATSELGNLLNQGYPFQAFGFTSSSTYPLDPVTAAPPPLTLANLSSPSATLAAFTPNLNLPYSLEWNAAMEQALGKEQNISASYLGSAGRRLVQSAFIFAPNPNVGNALLVGNGATSGYNALQIQFQRRLSRGLQVLSSYTWAHSIDDASAGSFGNGSNTAAPTVSPNANRGPSSFDIRNAFTAGVTYDVPAPKMNAFTNAILRGWSVQNIIQARSATPVDVVDGFFFQFHNSIANVRPDLVLGQPVYLYGPQYPGGKAFNPAAFTNPPTDSNGNPLRQGNLSRNALRGFGATQWDFAVHRDFPIHESLKLQFRAEMFNVLNHPNFGQPRSDISSSSFGRATQMLGRSLDQNTGAGGFSALYQIGGPRSIQLALKVLF